VINGMNEVLIGGQGREVLFVVRVYVPVKFSPVFVPGEETEDCQGHQLCYSEIMLLGRRSNVIGALDGVTNEWQYRLDEIVHETVDGNEYEFKVSVV